MGGTLRAWIRGIVVSMTLMGTLAAVGLGLIGLPGWLPLSALVFVGTFVPYVGAFVSTVTDGRDRASVKRPRGGRGA